MPPITAPPTVWRRLMLTNTRDVPPHLAYRAPMLRVADTKSEELPPFLSSMGRCPKSGLHNPIKAPERYVMYGDVSFRCAGLRGGRWGPALDPDAGGGLATCRGAGFGKGAAFLAWWQEPCAAAGNCRRRCLSPEPSPPPVFSAAAEMRKPEVAEFFTRLIMRVMPKVRADRPEGPPLWRVRPDCTPFLPAC